MSPRSLSRWVVGITVLTLGLAQVQPARAADIAKAKNDWALKEIPADASFYASWLRNREQVEIVGKSKSWKKITSMPSIQMGWMMFQQMMAQPGGPMAQFQQWYAQPENKQLVDLVTDMVSHEIYVYGGANWSECVDLFAQLYTTAQIANVQNEIGGGRGKKSEIAVARSILETLAKNPKLIQTPEFIVGFKLSDAKPAAAQLKRLEKLLEAVAMQEPMLKGRIKREKVAGGEFLTLNVDGSMVPWDQFPLNDIEKQPGEFKGVMQQLKNMKVAVSVGVRGNYLLLAVGSSSANIAKLGKGKSLLDLPEFKPFAKFADQRITSITYVSKAMSARVGTSKKDIDKAMSLVTDQLLPLVKVKPDQLKRIKKDLADLATDIKGYIPEPSASLGFSFLNKRGWESYSYSWTLPNDQDGSKPLPLLEHVGGDPLLAFVGRAKYSPQEWPRFVRWAKVGFGYFEEFALPHMKDKEKAQYQKVMAVVKPALAKMEDVTGKLLLPSLADGQQGLVLDTKLASNQWVKGMPQSPRPLPIIEPALVVGVSDADKLKKAFGEYRVTLNKMFADLKKLNKDIPEFKMPALEIPEPKTLKLKGGTCYYYPLPDKLGLDKRIQPNAALSAKVAVLAISTEHSDRLLKATPLKVDGGPLANTKRPLLSATYFNVAQFFDALYPWTEFAFAQAGNKIPPGPQGESKDDILKQLKTTYEVLKVFNRYTSATYLEGAAVVTHGEMVLKDE